MTVRNAIVWALALVSVLPLASGQSWSGLRVARIAFEPAEQPLTPAQLDARTALRAGDTFSTEGVRDTVHALYGSGRYSQITASGQETPDGLVLTFRTELAWFLGNTAVSGYPPPPSERQLITAADLRLGERLTEQRIAEAIRGMRALLADNGFPQALIRVHRHPRPIDQQVDLDFEVIPGERAEFGQIILTGSGDLPPERVREITHWTRDKPFEQRRVNRGLDRLRKHYRKRDFWQSEARVTASLFESGENDMTIVMRLDPGPEVVVEVSGASFSERDLRRYLPIYEEGTIDEDLLEEGVQNLRNALQSKGYFNAEVDYEWNQSDPERQLIRYLVERGERNKLARVDVTGNFFFDEETIRERLLIQEASFSLRRGRFSRGLVDRDRRAIEALYESNGFREVDVVTTIDEQYQDKPNTLAVSFTIEEGPITLVESLEIIGDEAIPQETYREELAAIEGQPYSEISIATDRELILTDYYRQGYETVSFTWERIETGDPERVRLVYRIDEGERYEVRETILSGLQRTKPALVNPRVTLDSGDPLSQAAMFDVQRQLYDLGIFSEVDAALQNPQGDETERVVLVNVREARRWAFGVGGGAEFARIGGLTDDITAPVGDASFSPRITLEATRLNMLGVGHTLSVRTRFSNLQQRAFLTYDAPRWTGSDKWRMTLSGLFDTSRNVRTYTGTRFEGAVQMRHRISKPSTGIYRYTFRRTTIDENSLQITPLLIPLLSQPVRVGLFSGTYLQDKRDDPTDATRGIFSSIDLGIASRAWGSQPNFFRTLLQNATYYPLTRRVVLARSLQFGIMTPWGAQPEGAAIPGLDDIEATVDSRLPLSERFFAGGANVHRGFPVNQAGPRDPTTGFPIGGGALLVNSVELRFPLIGSNIGGVLFHDAGNVYSRPGQIGFDSKQTRIPVEDGPDQFEFDYMVHAVGLGFRYKTPVGPLRLDLGYSVNPPRFIGFQGTRDELLSGTGQIREQRISHFQFHFSLGQTF